MYFNTKSSVNLERFSNQVAQFIPEWFLFKKVKALLHNVKRVLLPLALEGRSSAVSTLLERTNKVSYVFEGKKFN